MLTFGRSRVKSENSGGPGLKFGALVFWTHSVSTLDPTRVWLLCSSYIIVTVVVVAAVVVAAAGVGGGVVVGGVGVGGVLVVTILSQKKVSCKTLALKLERRAIKIRAVRPDPRSGQKNLGPLFYGPIWFPH